MPRVQEDTPYALHTSQSDLNAQRMTPDTYEVSGALLKTSHIEYTSTILSVRARTDIVTGVITVTATHGMYCQLYDTTYACDGAVHVQV